PVGASDVAVVSAGAADVSAAASAVVSVAAVLVAAVPVSVVSVDAVSSSLPHAASTTTIAVAIARILRLVLMLPFLVVRRVAIDRGRPARRRPRRTPLRAAR